MSILDDIERFLFKVTTLERILINGVCFVVGFSVGVAFL